ncbi:MAG: sugar-binding protein [Bacillota bacterium]|nr:sugar-binding protein [Bacillota bacterium]HPZ73444.1 sugar-binding protein [Bacillota bacterium]
MRKWLGIVFLVVFVCSTVGFAEAFVEAKFTDKPPKIDGVLDDEIWAKIVPRSDFSISTGGTPDLKTEFWVAWDWDHLYVAIKNYVDTSKLAKNITVDGGATWEDDENSVFLNPAFPEQVSMFQFSFNSIPVRTGLAYGGTPRPEYDFWEVAIVEAEDYYIAEVKIAFDAVWAWPEVGDLWGFNIGRGCTVTGKAYSWSPLKSGNFIDATSFGILEFVK